MEKVAQEHADPRIINKAFIKYLKDKPIIIPIYFIIPSVLTILESYINKSNKIDTVPETGGLVIINNVATIFFKGFKYFIKVNHNDPRLMG